MLEKFCDEEIRKAWSVCPEQAALGWGCICE
jgi:hypothetical protein